MEPADLPTPHIYHLVCLCFWNFFLVLLQTFLTCLKCRALGRRAHLVTYVRLLLFSIFVHMAVLKQVITLLLSLAGVTHEVDAASTCYTKSLHQVNLLAPRQFEPCPQLDLITSSRIDHQAVCCMMMIQLC